MNIAKLKKDMFACLHERGDIPTQQEFEAIFENLVRIAVKHVREAYDDGHAEGFTRAMSMSDENRQKIHDDGYRTGLAKAQLLADNEMIAERSRQSFMARSPGAIQGMSGSMLK